MSTPSSRPEGSAIQEQLADPKAAAARHKKNQRPHQQESGGDPSHRAESIAHPEDVIDVGAPDLDESYPPLDESGGGKTASGSPGEREIKKIRACLLEDPYALDEAVSLKSQLAGDGYEIDQFYSAKECQSALFGRDHDLLVVSCPAGAAGIENLIRGLRAQEKFAPGKLVVVVVTDDSNRETIEALYHAGTDEVITKPFQVALKDSVNALIMRNRARNRTANSAAALSICLFEDSHALGQIFVKNFQRRGHATDYFSEVGEALKNLSVKKYNLLIVGQSDYGDGKETVRLIESFRRANDPESAKIPVVVLAPDTSAENVKSLTSAGASLVLAKRVNGKLNANIFEVAQAIGAISSAGAASTVQPKQSDESIPVLTLDVPAVAKVKRQPPEQQKKPDRPGYDSLPQRRPRDPAASSGNKVVQGPDQELQPPPQQPAQKREKRLPLTWRSLPLAVGASLILIVFTGFMIRDQFTAAASVNVVEVRQGSLSQSVRGSGKVVTRKQVDLTSSTSGQVAKVFVEEGSKVKKGALLALLDDREARIKLKRAEAEYSSIRAELESKRVSLEELKKGSDGDKLTGFLVRDFESGYNALRANFRIAGEELQAAQLAMEQLQVIAPFDAIVLDSFAVEGAWVVPPEPLFKLVDPARLEAALLVKGSDARSLDVGLPVIISGGSLSAEEWKGEVVHISFEEKNLVRDDPVVIYSSLGSAASDVRYGQTVDARIITETSNDAIKLPFEAVFERDNQSVVAIVENERVKFKPVDVGIRDLTEVEIVKGLRAGQPVILAGSGLEEGMRVKPLLVKEEKSEDESGFPYREKFADVAILSTEQLRKAYDRAIIVDVRSNFEFDVVHINKAVNIPLASDNFIVQLGRLRGKSDSKPIVFYCNGHTCTKSYKAVQAAMAAGFKEVYAYDSGIFDWLRANRDYTTLLEVTPAPFDKLVSSDYFQSRLLGFDKFKEKAGTKGTVVIDIRDDLQRATKLAMPTVELPLDQLLAKLNAGEYKDKQLLIFDAVGQQVRWLQYVLKDKGYENYYFLRGGIDGVSG